MNKSRQMHWSRRGPNLLLQVRCAVYNGELGCGWAPVCARFSFEGANAASGVTPLSGQSRQLRTHGYIPVWRRSTRQRSEAINSLFQAAKRKEL